MFIVSPPQPNFPLVANIVSFRASVTILNFSHRLRNTIQVAFFTIKANKRCKKSLLLLLLDAVYRFFFTFPLIHLGCCVTHDSSSIAVVPYRLYCACYTLSVLCYFFLFLWRNVLHRWLESMRSHTLGSITLFYFVCFCHSFRSVVAPQSFICAVQLFIF